MVKMCPLIDAMNHIDYIFHTLFQKKIKIHPLIDALKIINYLSTSSIHVYKKSKDEIYHTCTSAS